jgi:hypothetical protein
MLAPVVEKLTASNDSKAIDEFAKKKNKVLGPFREEINEFCLKYLAHLIRIEESDCQIVDSPDVPEILKMFE